MNALTFSIPIAFHHPRIIYSSRWFDIAWLRVTIGPRGHRYMQTQYVCYLRLGPWAWLRTNVEGLTLKEVAK